MKLNDFVPRKSDAGRASLFLFCLALGACSGNSGGGSNTSNASAEEGQIVTDPLASWIVNTLERSSHIFESNSNTGVVEDVQLAELRTVDDAEYVYIETTGVPHYDVQMTQALVDSLNARPRAATDFAGGSTIAEVGQTIAFGEDIGYVNGGANCASTGGEGYWPFGPDCPTDQGKAEFIPVVPSVSSASCEAGLGAIGLMVNGTSIFNWGDGQSYGANVWYTLAPVAEQYDVDICGGHAAMGDYHHHFYTQCLADLVGDDGTRHSPIYGYIADGYPLYGPYEGDGVLAVSGWTTRDYGASAAEGGCGTPGERTCILNDATDLTQGVSVVAQAPDIGAAVTTMSGNPLNADDGYYMEDYYYPGLAVTGAQLDQHNGHDTGDGRGYHYHITLLDDGKGKLSPAYPYMAGPTFYGNLPDNAITACGGLAPPPGGAAPAGPPP